MDPHTARWYVTASLSLMFLPSIDSTSLQLSTSISMPFHPYRPHRLPDSHFNRPRGPVQMPPKPARPQPGRAFSYDASVSGMPYKPIYHTSHQSTASPVENVNATPPLTTMCTPDSFSMGSTYLQPCVSPETANPSDMWASCTLTFSRDEQS